MFTNRWTDEMREYLKQNYLKVPAEQLAFMMEKKFGIAMNKNIVRKQYYYISRQNPYLKLKCREQESFCKYNGGVLCEEEGPKCHKCGWNPEEALRRHIERLKMEAELNETISE